MKYFFPFFAFLFHSLPAFSYSDKQEFDSKNLKNLIVENYIGNIFINSTDKPVTTVAFTKNKFSEQCNMTIKKSGSQLIVKVSTKKYLSKECEVDFEIIVPKSLDLKLTNGKGNFKIQNIAGRLDFKIGKGDMYAKGKFAVVNGKVGAGDIDINGVQQDADLKMGYGNLNIWFLEDSSRGKLNLKTGNGNIVVFLPKGSTTTVDYKSATGKVINPFQNDQTGSFKVNVFSGIGNLTLKEQ